MTCTRGIFSFLTCTAMIWVVHSHTDGLPPPTAPSYKWLDPFTVMVSWTKPSNLLDGTHVQYRYCLMNNGTDNFPGCTRWGNFIESCLTEDMGPDGWTYNIWTVGKYCNHSNGNQHAAITIAPPIPRAELVKDFKCVVYKTQMKCSWIPVNRSQNLTFSYRLCGRSQEHIKKLKECDRPFSSGERNGCYLPIDKEQDNICMLVETEDGMSTFKPELVVPPPDLNITEEEDKLKLKFTVPVFECSCWMYEVCYTQCGRPQNCQNIRCYEVPTMEVPYDKACRYEFKSRVRSNEQCIKIVSNFSASVTYGANDGTVIVVAIIIPVILSVFVILSCSCFRRHSAIICPAVPDPSAIFKEMMMNGNKEHLATKGSLYTPVPEPIEPCKITLATDKNKIHQQNC